MSEPEYKPTSRAWGRKRVAVMYRLSPGLRVAAKEETERIRTENGWDRNNFGESAYIEAQLLHKNPRLRSRANEINKEWKKDARRYKLGSTAQG